MSQNNSDAGAIKRRLMSLYESASPQLYTQILVDYDAAARRLGTESTRIHDVRAAARLQILFADGFKAAAAVRFLQEAIRHIEEFGLPPAESPALFPDGGESPHGLAAPAPPESAAFTER